MASTTKTAVTVVLPDGCNDESEWVAGGAAVRGAVGGFPHPGGFVAVAAPGWACVPRLPTGGERRGVNLSDAETNGPDAGAAFSQVIAAFTQVDRWCPRQDSNL